jgi:hypothetical protein
VKPLELRFYCDKKECQKRSQYFLQKIKRTRHISLRNFDLYDLDRPIKHNDKIVAHERVCRICGAPLRKVDGSYSPHKKYCHQSRFCSGYHLYELVNWGSTSSKYISKVRRTYFNEIKEFIEDHKIDETFTPYYFVICEECKKICLESNLHQYYLNPGEREKVRKLSLPIINIHHIQPVHTLTWENLYLIWDKRNLKALCPECHNNQNHYLKTKTNSHLNFMKITEFMGKK